MDFRRTRAESGSAVRYKTTGAFVPVTFNVMGYRRCAARSLQHTAMPLDHSAVL
jgi:hypothetical protein